MIRASEAEVRKHRASGAWRRASAVDDVTRWASATPDAPALLAHRSDRGLTLVTWSELASWVERFSGALAELGVGRGDVVAMQLPNWWQAAAIAVATWRRGAVLAPIMTTIRERELERMLRRVEARVAITTDVWDGHDHAAVLGRIAPRLPTLRHRVILGANTREDEVSFDEFFLRSVHPERDAAVSDPDALAQILFTSGTTGEPKAAMRTQNNHYAQMRPSMDDALGDPVRRTYTPQSIMHSAGLGCLIQMLVVGGTLLLTDLWQPDRVSRLLAEHGVEQVTLVPSFLRELLGAVRAAHVRLPALREVYAVGSTIDHDLVDKTSDVLGLRLRSVWAMTEGGRANTDGQDPPGWAAHSIGRPPPGTELALWPASVGASVDEHNPGTLMMRGASVCLATQVRDGGALRMTADHDEGWYDTGDLAVADGRNGFRLVGRAADRVGGGFMIPVADVEETLRSHPRIVDVAIVGHRDNTEGCAIVVAEGHIDLTEIRGHLGKEGMTEWYWPTRVEQIDALPRNAMGKVEKTRLRSWLRAGR